MAYIFLKCTACDTENDIYCDGDNAMMCPECRTVDEFEEAEEENKPCNFCSGSGEGYYSNESRCIHCNGKGVL